MFETLEEAQAEIIRLQEANAQLTTERDTLSQNNETLSGELASVKQLNQQYFNKLSQQFLPAEGKKDNEQEAPSCQEFAKTLTQYF